MKDWVITVILIALLVVFIFQVFYPFAVRTNEAYKKCEDAGGVMVKAKCVQPVEYK